VKLHEPGGSDLSTHDGILAHYGAFWGADRVDEVHWTPGRIGERLPDLHIVKIRPGAEADMWTFATIGAWRANEDEKHNLEFLAVARAEDASILWHMALTAYYHAGPAENRLGVGHTVPIGEGWVEGSPLDAVLVALPYLWGPKLENCLLRDRHVQVVWLMPITQAEREFAHEHGVDALEQRFEDTKVDYLDPFRKSVVAKDARS
jgi:hypothetical protein